MTRYLIAAVLLLAGCSTGTDGPIRAAPDGVFITQVGDYPASWGKPEDLIGMGHDICAALDAGVPRERIQEQLAVDLAGEGFEARQRLVGAAIIAYCPVYA